MAPIIVLLIIALILSALFFAFLVGTLLAFLPWVLLGLLAGWLASLITGSRHGVMGDIGIGLAGSLIGSILYALLTGHQPGGPLSFNHLLAAIVGSVILLSILKVRSRTA